MQFRVAAGTPVSFNPATLNSALPAAFAASQDPIIVPEAAYNTAYGNVFTNKYVKIADNSVTFNPIGTTSPLTSPFHQW